MKLKMTEQQFIKNGMRSITELYLKMINRAEEKGSKENPMTVSLIAVNQDIYENLLRRQYRRDFPLMTGKKDGTNRFIRYHSENMTFTDASDGRMIIPYGIGGEPQALTRYGAEIKRLRDAGVKNPTIFRYDDKGKYIGAEINGQIVPPEQLSDPV